MTTLSAARGRAKVKIRVACAYSLRSSLTRREAEKNLALYGYYDVSEVLALRPILVL